MGYGVRFKGKESAVLTHEYRRAVLKSRFFFRRRQILVLARLYYYRTPAASYRSRILHLSVLCILSIHRIGLRGANRGW